MEKFPVIVAFLLNARRLLNLVLLKLVVSRVDGLDRGLFIRRVVVAKKNSRVIVYVAIFGYLPDQDIAGFKLEGQLFLETWCFGL